MKHPKMALTGLLMLALTMVPAATATSGPGGVDIKNCDSTDPSASEMSTGKFADPCAKTDYALGKFIAGLKLIAGPLFGLILIGSGIAWGTSGSNDKMRAGAKAGAIAAGIGLIIVLMSDTLMNFIKGAFGG